MPPSPKVIVVGGGAAGLIAAMTASRSGADVTLLEKSDRVGMKILISGGGKCNITHDGSVDQILRPFRRNEALFLKPSFYRYTNKEILTIFHERFIPTYVRSDGRVFPVEPKNAKDVVNALEKACISAGVKIKTDCGVTGILAIDGIATGVDIHGETMDADAVVIAVGGSSYPATGTTGDGWRWAEDLGHSIVPLRAALAPIYIEEPRAEWSGVTLTDVKLVARIAESQKIVAKWSGDLLFTHKGISGPCALGVSREIAEIITPNPYENITLGLDLVESLTFEDLTARALREPIETVQAIVQRYLPKRLADDMIYSLKLTGQTKLSALPQKTLNRLFTTVKEWPIGRVRAIPLERGEVVAGGVNLDEVDPKTMRSKLVERLYLCGEVLDIAGPVGGYNLQAAWSTGFVAGYDAARWHVSHESERPSL